ncbi:MAG TPA: protease [Pseudohongiella sp.]|nr:protease [Pseudohongiella sp.]HBX36588.1 protease [Pseudohongiella sp.]|tara:strand:+ start:12300 stop:13847 length:1548 start_codon:yes stop_codon:yes gene_type:complete
MTAAGLVATRRWLLLSAVLVASSLLILTGGAANAQTSDEIREIEDSIVKIYTTTADPDYFTPWRLMNPNQSSGSGAVIEGNRILTNAHVVANASYVQVQKNSDPRRYLARVEFVSHSSDLALIQVEEPGFFDDAPPLEIGDLPDPNTEVLVFGYPIGGRTLSVTKGVLSRVEQQVYAHSGEFLLAGQIDAAINPGNSGGPVIADGEIVGVVMQSAGGGRTEALGYFVPTDIVRHMLTDASDGQFDGFPDLGFRTQDLESPAAKARYGLAEDETGVLVIKVFEDSPADGLLKANDVLLSIDGYEVAGDSSIRLNRDLQTNYKHAIDVKQIGDTVPLRIARQGVAMDVDLTAQRRQQSYSLVRSEEFDAIPDYYIYGGIVFVPLNMNLIKRWGSDWTRTAPVNLLHARSQWSSPEKREVIVALQVLAADVNLGYHDVRNVIVESVNGEPIRDFGEFARLLRNNEEPYIVFEAESGFQMVVDHQQARDSEAEILERYRIPASYSEGLFDQSALAQHEE